jgi:hypothetical protein
MRSPDAYPPLVAVGERSLVVGWTARGFRGTAVERLVTAAVVIVVGEEDLEEPEQVPLPEDDHMVEQVEQVPTDGADQALR